MYLFFNDLSYETRTYSEEGLPLGARVSSLRAGLFL